MSRIALIARREFLTNVKRRSFLFTAFGLPIIIIAIQFALGYFIEHQSETTGTLGQIGYVDLTPEQILSRAANKPAEYRAFADADSAQSALLAREIGAYFVVPQDYLEQGVVHAYSTRDIPRGIENQMAVFLTQNLLVDWPAERAARLQNPANLTIATLGGGKEIDEQASIAVILLPFIFAMLFVMSVFTTSGFLMQGVVEEKENRLVEILMTSITPLQMLWGKILGLGALSLLQVGVWAAAGGLVLAQGSNIWEGLEDVTVPTALLVISPVYLVLGYLLYGALLAGIGASVPSMQEGQQIAGIISLIAVIPLMLAFTIIENANGILPAIMSLFPFTAPLGMMLRVPFADVPIWQIGLSIALLVLTTLAVVWIAAQVFRIGLLMYGKRLGLRPLWAALRQSARAAPIQARGGLE